jgi:hypothetical protein
MKVVSQLDQLAMMEIVACAAGTTDYEDVRRMMFDAFNAEYGKGKWTFDPLTVTQQREFTKFLEEA